MMGMERLMMERVSDPLEATLVLSCRDADKRIAIEARVARIKARVAELTGNMEDGANGSRTHSPSRR